LLRRLQLERFRVVVDLALKRALPRALVFRVELVRLVVPLVVRRVVLDFLAFQALWKQLISIRRTLRPAVGFHQQHGTWFFIAKLLTVALLLHPL
jgi:hypothetical protein